MSERLKLDAKRDPDLLFIPYVYCLEIVGKKMSLQIKQCYIITIFIISKDLENLNQVLSKRNMKYFCDDFFEILISIYKIRKSIAIADFSQKQVDDYLYFRSWLGLHFSDQTYLWNFYKSEKAIVLPLNIQILSSKSFEEEKF